MSRRYRGGEADPTVAHVRGLARRPDPPATIATSQAVQISRPAPAEARMEKVWRSCEDHLREGRRPFSRRARAPCGEVERPFPARRGRSLSSRTQTTVRATANKIHGAATIRSFPLIRSPSCRGCSRQCTRRPYPRGEAVMVTGWRCPAGPGADGTGRPGVGIIREPGRTGRETGRSAAMAATVLVVEDERKLRDLVRSYLERAGFTVLSTGSGAEAISMATSAAPDLVVLDLGLPDVAGETVARELRVSGPVPIVMLTARSHRGGPDRRARAGRRRLRDQAVQPAGAGAAGPGDPAPRRAGRRRGGHELRRRHAGHRRAAARGDGPRRSRSS